MAFVLLGDIWQVRLGTYTPNQAGINVVNFRCSAHAGVGATDAEMATAINSAVTGPYKDVLSDDARWRGVSVGRILPLPPTAPSVTTVTDGVGGVAGELLPQQVSGIISVRTAFAGPRFRGRIYVAFPSEASNEVPGLPTAAYTAALQVLANTVFTSFTFGAGANTSTIKPIIRHRDLNTYTDVTTAAAKVAWATQRRRGSYGRPNLAPF